MSIFLSSNPRRHRQSPPDQAEPQPFFSPTQEKTGQTTSGFFPPSIQRLATPDEEKMPGTNDERMREDKMIQQKPEEEMLQGKAESNGGLSASPQISSQIERSHGHGQALPESTRAEMESGIGADLSGVRVHMDPESAMLNRALGARAFTHGQDIYFNTGHFNPAQMEGKRLLAHELTHVVQQGKGVRRIQRAIGDGHDLSSAQLAGDPVLEACHDNEQVLEYGSEGEAVRKVQQALTSLKDEQGNPKYELGKPDGIYGNKTKAAVLKFQTDENLVRQEGRTGFETIGRLDSKLREPAPRPPGPSPGPTPQPDEDAGAETCSPQAGIPNSDCGAYAREIWWLPDAYVHNATCACQETPNEPTADCVRMFLQDRLKKVDPAVQRKANIAKGMLIAHAISRAEYENFVQLELTPLIFRDHVDAYQHCCCSSGPAPLWAWRMVTMVPIPCPMVGFSIRRYGSCHGTPGAW